MDELPLAAGAAFGLTVLLMPVVLVGLRRLDALDHPNDRSSHEVPTLRGGGIGPWLACLAVLAAVPGIDTRTRVSLVVVAAGFGLLGTIEDLRGLSANRRLLTQVLIAATAAYSMHPLVDHFRWNIVAMAIVVAWLVSYVNAFNFMDGINGISAAQVLAAGVGFVMMGWHIDATPLAAAGALVAAAALGFAPFNFPRARVFLGDSGSYFLGGWLALLAVIAFASGVPVEAVAAPFLIYLADTGTTLVKRVRRREAWHQPHRSHIYQQLTRLGWSHTKTTGWVFVAIGGCVALGVAALGASTPGRIAAMLGMAALVATYLSTPALVDRFGARRMVKF